MPIARASQRARRTSGAEHHGNDLPRSDGGGPSTRRPAQHRRWITVDNVNNAYRRSPGSGALLDIITCLTFHDTDTRTVKRFHVTFAYFDAGGKRNAGDSFAREGTFATNAARGVNQ